MGVRWSGFCVNVMQSVGPFVSGRESDVWPKVCGGYMGMGEWENMIHC